MLFIALTPEELELLKVPLRNPLDSALSGGGPIAVTLEQQIYGSIADMIVKPGGQLRL